MRRRRTGDTAERIAEAALHILVEEGVQAVTMHGVAQRLAITPMAIYHYYKNRDALLQHIVDREILRLADIGRRLISTTVYIERERIVDAYLDYAFSRPHIFDYVFNTPRAGGLKYPADFRGGRSPSLNPVAEHVGELMRSEAIKTDDVWEVTMQLWAHAHGYVALRRAGRFDLDDVAFRELYHRAVRRLFTGLAHDPEPSTSTRATPKRPVSKNRVGSPPFAKRSRS